MFSIKRPEQVSISVPDYLHTKTCPGLTGIRGLAIIIVLLYHLGINHLLRSFNGHMTGRTGVDIFFLLSGFLITTLLLKEKIRAGQISLSNFYARRALRILPVAYLFLLSMIIFNLAFKLAITKASFLTGFLLLKNLPIISVHDRWTRHFWSLSVEEQFYLFFPLLLKWVNLDKILILIATTITTVLAFSIAGAHHLLDGQTLLLEFSRLAVFFFWQGPFAILLGCLFSILVFKGFKFNCTTKRNSVLAGLFLATAILIRSPTFTFYTPFFCEFMADILVGFVIVLIVSRSGALAKLLNSRFLILMGTLSYSIYVWQQLFISIPIQVPSSHLLGFGTAFWFVLIDVLRLICISLVSGLSYYFFEKKFLRLKVLFR